MPNFPFVVSDSLQIGTATISATGNAIVLPSGTQVGSTPVATTQEVATGGGPKISNLQITDNSWAVLDDTAVDTAGGYVLITGTNFVTGALVYFNQTPANSVAFVSATILRVTVPELTAGTYIVYVINPDGGTAIRVPGLTASANPAWQTASALPEQYDGAEITLNLVATDATSYTLVSGSLPPGLSLNSNTGVITGTVTSVTVDTTYTFTVRATDAQLQDSPRTFTVTVSVSDTYFRLTTLLLSGSAISTNTVVRDSSTNNFNLTVAGDARASNFTPYGTGWSVYFDGTGDYLELATNTAFDLPGDYTIEFWMYLVVLATNANYYVATRGTYQSGSQDWYIALDQANKGISFVFGPSSSIVLYAGVIPVNTWTHVAFSRSGSTARSFLNGVLRSSITDTTNLTNTRSLRIGADSGATINNLFSGYLSNWRIIKGTALYTANFTPATTTLTSVANTSLLTCHANRFLDSSTNNFAITRNGDARVTSFNPFNITNTGVNGSAYFDGTGDYITVPDNANLEPLGGNFTIETWFYLNAVTTGTQICGKSWWTPFYIEGTNLVTYLSSNGSTWDIASNQVIITSVATFRWYHVAMVRNGTSIKAYVNGTETLSLTSSAALHDGSDALTIGARGTTYLNGYVADLRFVKGTAVYTANFTPPTQPLTAITNTQLLTLQYRQPHNNHTFLDSSSNQFVITRNGNATQGTFSPFSPGGWSNYFDGTGDYLTIPSNAAFVWGTGDFTVECWVNTPAAPGGGVNYDKAIFGSFNYTPAFFIFLTNDANFPAIYNGSLQITSTLSVTANQWTHIAWVRSNNNMTFYVNGQSGGTFAYATNWTASNTSFIGRSNSDTTRNFPGYISNLRVVKGVAVYTGPFTPSTQLLSATQSAGANISAITGTQTSLLTCHANRFIDASTNNFAITVTGDTRVVAFSPFAPTAVYNPVSHGGSGYVDGSGDYFILTNESAYDFGDGNFSIDFWYYPLSAQGYGGIYMRDGQDYPLGIYSGTSITPAWPECSMSVGTTTTWFATGINTSGVQKYAWNHIAFTRVGNTFRAFTNGVLSSVVTASGTMGSGGTPWIGKNGTAAGQSELSMYLSGFRMTKGGIPTLFSTSSTTTGTTIFAVPTQPFTANDSLTGGSLSILANFADAAILDSTGRTVIETVADAKSSSVITKFTGGSMYFDGTGDYLSIPNNITLNLQSGDFTVECWLYTNNAATSQTFIWLGGNDSSSATLRFAVETNGINLYMGNSGLTGWEVTTGIVGSISSTTWTHVAATRSGNNYRVFINGSQVGTTITNSNAIGASTQNRIGSLNFTSGGFPVYREFNGYIQDLRITRGYARYTANFTAPTAPARLK